MWKTQYSAVENFEQRLLRGKVGEGLQRIDLPRRKATLLGTRSQPAASAVPPRRSRRARTKTRATEHNFATGSGQGRDAHVADGYAARHSAMAVHAFHTDAVSCTSLSLKSSMKALSRKSPGKSQICW